MFHPLPHCENKQVKQTYVHNSRAARSGLPPYEARAPKSGGGCLPFPMAAPLLLYENGISIPGCPFYRWTQEFKFAAVEMSVWKGHHGWKSELYRYPFEKVFKLIEVKISSKKKDNTLGGPIPFFRARRSVWDRLMCTTVEHLDLGPPWEA